MILDLDIKHAYIFHAYASSQKAFAQIKFWNDLTYTFKTVEQGSTCGLLFRSPQLTSPSSYDP